MAAERRIPTALFGLGRIAWQLEKDPLRNKPCSHAGAIAAVRNGNRNVFHITSICDHNTQKIHEFQKFWKQPITCAERDYRAIFRHAVPELAVIAVSAESHTPIALHAIESGCRAIVLEKPMALSLSDARKIASAAERHNCQVRINFERRYHPGYIHVKRLITSHKFGDLRAIRGRVLTGAQIMPESSNAIPIGPLMHDAIHWIDLLLWYAGHPDKISARMIPAGRISRDLKIEDTAFVQFQYPDFTAILESGGRRRFFEFEMEVDLEAGRILCGNNGFRFFASRKSRRYRHFRELQEANIKIPQKNQSPWTRLYTDVYKALRNSKTYAPETTESRLRDAVTGMELIHKCYKSI